VSCYGGSLLAGSQGVPPTPQLAHRDYRAGAASDRRRSERCRVWSPTRLSATVTPPSSRRARTGGSARQRQAPCRKASVATVRRRFFLMLSFQSAVLTGPAARGELRCTRRQPGQRSSQDPRPAAKSKPSGVVY
jgi:hypothetical protein